MEISKPAPPLLNEQNTALEQRSPTNPPINWGIFLISQQEMKSLYSTALHITVITLQGRFIIATCTLHGRVLTAEPKALMNLKFTIATGN